jgi:hypothetical protein
LIDSTAVLVVVVVVVVVAMDGGVVVTAQRERVVAHPDLYGSGVTLAGLRKDRMGSVVMRRSACR